METANVEIELLLCCLKKQICGDSNYDKKIAELLSKSLNWDYFISITSSNRVTLLVYKSLQSIPGRRLPNNILNHFIVGTNKILAHHIKHVSALETIIKLLQKDNIFVIPMKGPVLGILYGSLGFREWGDLDIIVYQQDIYKVKHILNSCGYEEESKGQPYELQNLLKWSHSCYFHNKGCDIGIDVHWSLANKTDYLHFDLPAILGDSCTRSFYGMEIRLLKSESLLLVTTIHHGCRNLWGELRYLCDIVNIIKNYDDIDWERMIILAKKIGIKRTLLLGISLANVLYGFNLPKSIEAEIIKDKKIKKLGQYVYKNLFRLHKADNYLSSFANLISNEWLKISLRENIYIKFRLGVHLYFELTKRFIKEGI